MASGKSNYKTPDQPNRVKRDVIDPSPNLNMVYQTLPDLTPPRKIKYSEPFSTIGAAGASPSGTEFGFPRPHESPPGAFRSGSDGKGDPSFDLFGFRSTPAKGRSPIFDLSSPRSTGLQPPPVPIFQPSPRRASDASTYMSPASRNRRSSLTSSGAAGGKAFSFSPQPAFASPPATTAGAGAHATNAGGATTTTNGNGGHASITSVFASILGDAHSRISPTNLSAVAAAARDGSAVRAHFGGIFTGEAAAAAAGGASTGGGAGAGGGAGVTGSGATGAATVATGGVAQPGSSMLIPVEGYAGGSSPLQLHSARPTATTTPISNGSGGEDADGDGQDDNDGYDAVAARRPSRRRALDFDGAATAHAATAHAVDDGDNNANTAAIILNSNDAIKYEIGNLLSPTMGAVAIDSIEAFLPIARLRDSTDEDDGGSDGIRGGNGEHSGFIHTTSGRTPMLVPSFTRGVSGPTVGGVSVLPGLTRGGGGGGMSLMDSLAQSPISMRPGIIRREDIIDSPAVKEATNAAVAAALQANAERRPARAAAAGAAAAAAAAAGGTPMSRRPSTVHHPPGSSGLFDASGLLSAAGGGVPAGGIRCNCKKSRCMKLYCDCFKALGYCGEGCSCVGCSNREDNAPAVNQARESILQRNPQAFTDKISPIDPSGLVAGTLGDGFSGLGGGISGVAGGGAQHRRGCNCKKSKCLKKYCECFQAGIACGDSCKCDGCHNTTEAMASGRPPFDKKRIATTPTHQQEPTQQQNVNGIVALSGGDVGVGVDGKSNSGDDSGVGSVNPSAAAKTAASIAPAAPGMPQQAFAALGPAFQQILLQRAFTGNHGAGVAAGAGAGAGTTPPGGQNGKPGSLTVNNQLLVPISWPLGAAAAPGATPGTTSSTTATPTPATAQQLLNLAASGAIPAFSNQIAAAVAAAQQNAANVAAAQAAANAAAHAAAQNTNGKTTPSIGPSVQEDPSSAQAGTDQQPSDGTNGTEGVGGVPRQAALADGGMSQQGAESSHRAGASRKPPLAPGGSTAATAAANGGAAAGASGSDEDAKPRLTPTKRKPARTMTAALM